MANIYMHRYLRYWEQTGQSERLRAKIINYADDFVILSRGKAAEALRWTTRVMNSLKLTLNATKTCIRNALRESFDFLGYTFGRMFGRHKLSPIVSPGKTWEGAIGGLLVAVLTSWLVFTFVARSMLGPDTRQIGMPTILLFGVAVAAAGIIGDLAESLLKRDAGVKDSSTWMPGFGGVLDLLDSLLGAAPVAYAIWAGAGVVLVALVSWVVFRETLTLVQIIGMGLVIGGVVMLELGAKHA